MNDYEVLVYAPSADAAAGAVTASGVARKLAAAGYRVLLTPNLYHLRPDSSVTDALVGLAEDGVVLGELYPRAAEWTLRALGVPFGGTCVDLRSVESEEECLIRVRAIRSMPSGGRGEVTVLDGQPAERWYPVVDHDACSGCGQCFDFCLFGVYALQGGRPRVSNPDNCKPGCPACARVCPEAAIMFPQFDDPAIAGATARRECSDRCQCDCGCNCDAGERQQQEDGDGLDELIDALEGLDG